MAPINLSSNFALFRCHIFEVQRGLMVKVLDSKGHGYDSHHWDVFLQPCFTSIASSFESDVKLRFLVPCVYAGASKRPHPGRL